MKVAVVQLCSPGLNCVICAGLKVLIVEDELIVADAMAQELRDAGALTVAARNVEYALSQLATTAFDVAVLDMDLAGRHVWPVAAALDALQVPFVLVTNYSALDVPAEFEGRLILARLIPAGSLALAVQRVAAVAGRHRATPIGLSFTGEAHSLTGHFTAVVN